MVRQRADEHRQHRRPTLRQWLAEGPFSLGLSSGFFGFFAHAGLLSVLEEQRLLPAALCGSSAGALVAGLWSGGLDASGICENLARLRREDFWDPGPGPGLLRGRLFRRHLESLLAAKTFDQCRARLFVSAFDMLALRTRVLDRGPLAPAIHASCAVPLMFQPVWIDGRPLLDGGISDRSGMRGLPPADRSRLLFHHLASRSPWRLRPPPVPSDAGLVALVVSGLPRVDPFHLDRAPQAIARARDATRRALDLALPANRLLAL